jgi:hypothetical protein
MIRSRLMSLVVTTIVGLAGLGIGTAAASVTGPAGAVAVRSIPPVCC